MPRSNVLNQLVRAAALAVLVCALGAGFAVAKTTDLFPQGPYQERLEAVTAALRSPDLQTMQALVREHLSEELAQLPLEAHVDYFRQLSSSLGSFEVNTVSDQGGGQFYIDLDPESGQGMRLLAEFDPNPPHGLLGLQPIPRVDMQRLDLADTAAVKAALSELSESGIFSGAMHIENEGKVLVRGAWGMADKRHGIPNSEQTRFAVGSITKAFTRLAAARLAIQGALDLQEPIGELVPELPERMRNSITPWHLLRHESGLTDYFGHPRYEKEKEHYLDVADYLPVISELELAFPPGTAQRYSNAGYVLLGVVIQRAAKQSYHDYVRKHVFGPAAMKDTDFEQPTLAGRPYATGYTNLSPLGPDEGFVRENTDLLPGIGTPAGTSYSTLDDLRRFTRSIWDETVFEPAALRLFHNLDTAESPDDAVEQPLPQAFAAAGGQPGENALVISVPSKQRLVVVLSNYDERLAEDIGMHLYEQLKTSD